MSMNLLIWIRIFWYEYESKVANMNLNVKNYIIIFIRFNPAIIIVTFLFKDQNLGIIFIIIWIFKKNYVINLS